MGVNYKNRECLELEKLKANPFEQFHKWFRETQNDSVTKPNAAFLSTLSEDFSPQSRTVMIKAYDYKGFVFFTQCDTNKVSQIAKNDRVFLLFSWLEVERQIKIEGRAKLISITDALFYFSNRGSKMGCWIEDDGLLSIRVFMEKQLGKMLEELHKKSIESSDIFCGYRIIPENIGFWQVCKDKLYQQFLYKKTQNGWSISEN